MPWGIAAAAIGVVGSVVAANKQSSAAKNAAQTQANASNQANQLQKQIYEQNVGYETPYMNTGTAAENQLATLMGLNGKSADYSSFLNSPDYQFALQQGMSNLDKSAAARGNLYSGGYGQQLVDYNQGLATQQYNNYYNKIAGLANQGQTAAAALSGVGENYANQAGQNLANAANATASGYLSQGNAQAGLYNQLGNIAGNVFSQYNNSAFNNYGLRNTSDGGIYDPNSIGMYAPDEGGSVAFGAGAF